MAHKGGCAVQQTERHQRTNRTTDLLGYFEPRDVRRILAFADSAARDLDVPPATRMPKMTDQRDLPTKAREDGDTGGLLVSRNNPMIKARLSIRKNHRFPQKNDVG